MMDRGRHPASVLVPWFWRNYARRAVPVLLLAFLFMAVEGGSLGALSYMVRPMFDDVFVAGDRGSVLLVGGIVSGIFVARAIAGMCQRVLTAIAERTISTRLQSALVAHLVGLDSSFFLQNPPGKLMERVRGDIAGAVGIVTTTFSAVGRDAVALVSLLGVAISIDWLWTLVALAGAPIIVVPVVFLQRRLRKLVRKSRELAARVSTQLDELFHGIDTVKLNAIEAQEAQRFDAVVMQTARNQVRTSATQAGIPALMDIVAAIGFFGVLTYGGFQIINGTKTIGDFMSFFTAIALVFEPVRRLGSLSGTWQRALVSMERVYNAFLVTPTIVSPAIPVPLPAAPAAADIELRDVQFAYGAVPILRGVSFTAAAGQTTALVGASGAGKTTVFRVLSRLIDPAAGVVTLGGTDLREFALGDLRKLIAVVTQDTLLFDQSLRDNILLGGAPDDSQLAAALKAAHVNDFSADLVRGLDSPAGPRGSNLSGGQRQRVAIARALLRNAPILLLDEATSALDTKSEAIVQDALDNLAQNRTTLVIAHRLSTIRKADKIVVMDRGRVVDQGSHEELMARDGLYAGLYRIQFRDSDSDA